MYLYKNRNRCTTYCILRLRLVSTFTLLTYQVPLPLARYRENLPIVIVHCLLLCGFHGGLLLALVCFPHPRCLRENICQKAAAARVPPRGAVSCCALPRGYYILNTITISLHLIFILIFSSLTVIRYVNYLHIRLTAQFVPCSL